MMDGDQSRRAAAHETRQADCDMPVLECPSGVSGRELAVQEADEGTTTSQQVADGQVRARCSRSAHARETAVTADDAECDAHAR
jgi:hypothetical protein